MSDNTPHNNEHNTTPAPPPEGGTSSYIASLCPGNAPDSPAELTEPWGGIDEDDNGMYVDRFGRPLYDLAAWSKDVMLGHEGDNLGARELLENKQLLLYWIYRFCRDDVEEARRGVREISHLYVPVTDWEHHTFVVKKIGELTGDEFNIIGAEERERNNSECYAPYMWEVGQWV